MWLFLVLRCGARSRGDADAAAATRLVGHGGTATSRGERRRRRRRGVATTRLRGAINVPAAPPPRRVAREYPRPGRGAAATRFRAISASRHVERAQVQGSFCSRNLDTLYAADGSTQSVNNYTLCMDFDNAMWTTVGLGAEDDVYANDTVWATVKGACTSRAAPDQGPPANIPFSFLVIDEDSRGAATYFRRV